MKALFQLLLRIATVIVAILLSSYVETQKDFLFFLIVSCLWVRVILLESQDKPS